MKLNRRQFLQVSGLSAGAGVITLAFKPKIILADNHTSCLPMCLPGCLHWKNSPETYIYRDEWAYSEPLGVKLTSFTARPYSLWEQLKDFFVSLFD